ncbi:MAG TPA: ferric reductase-like transmembrane domain-containing protein [Pseudonocardiaceae bacterium]|jgi:sulfoxide reductase heme-binding subunit YedZ|nr:ferric reductase-like transmembrane domain-containing protein [Pseudonocardiaceae bacterium]
MTTAALWYVGRGTGVVALVLFSVVVALGIATRAARPLFGLPRFAVLAVHRGASLLSLVFLVIHVFTMVLDPSAPLRLVDVIVPFAGPYRPFWLGLGTVAAELVVAVIVTSLSRHRIGYRAWRFVHWAAYVMWPVAVAHAIGTGTDNGRLWLWLTVAGCVALIGVCIGWRLSTGFAVRPQVARQLAGVR